MHEHVLEPTLSEDQFAGRFEKLHRQLWQSPEFSFNDVTRHVFAPPEGLCQADHSFIHDGANWHVFYCTGDMKLIEPWAELRRAGKCEAANEICAEPGNGHAVGKTLMDLEFVDNVFFPPQGRFDLISRGACSVFKFNGRYGMLYDVRGDLGEVMSVAWSDDLKTWELDERNPILLQPEWSNKAGAFKDPHIMEVDGVYLIYAVAWDRAGRVGICLITTDDWEHFHDQGLVFSTPPMMRGTFGLESPQVICRDGLWHLFYTQGTGLWHAIAPSATGFLAPAEQAHATRVARGPYLMGPFHATEIVQDGDRWYMTTDRKEYQRHLNRLARRPIYRAQYEDEQPLEEGIYLAQLIWEGDQPTLVKPGRP